MSIRGAAGDCAVNSLQFQFHWQTLTRWENYCQLIIIHIYIHIIFHQPGLPWKDRVFPRCYPLISMYERIAIELAIWTQTYDTLNSQQDMLWEISLLIRFQVSTILYWNYQHHLGIHPNTKFNTPGLSHLMGIPRTNPLHCCFQYLSCPYYKKYPKSSTTHVQMKLASHRTWQSCHMLPPIFPKTRLLSWRTLAINIHRLPSVQRSGMWRYDGCRWMSWFWVLGVEWCSGDVGNFICCYFASWWILVCLQILRWNPWIHESSK